MSINFQNLQTSQYETVTMVIQEIKLNVPEHKDNYFSAKGFLLYNFTDEKHSFNVKNIHNLIDSITDNYKPSQISYRYGFIRNILDAYAMLSMNNKHEEKCRELELLSALEEDEEEEYDDDDAYDTKYEKLRYMYSYFKSSTYNVFRQFYFDGIEIM